MKGRLYTAVVGPFAANGNFNMGPSAGNASAKQRWRIHSGTFKFVADATVADRTPRMFVADSVIGRVGPLFVCPTVITASQTKYFSFGPYSGVNTYVASPTAYDELMFVGLTNPIELVLGMVLSVTTLNGQAGDSIYLYYVGEDIVE